jgi:hypothetical protein
MRLTDCKLGVDLLGYYPAVFRRRSRYPASSDGFPEGLLDQPFTAGSIAVGATSPF